MASTLSHETPSPLRLGVLAIQHVLVMYAGTVAVPLILGAALKLPRDQVALLINADLFACGIATFIQAYGVGPVGIRMPVMMGVTFASLSPCSPWPTTRPWASRSSSAPSSSPASSAS